MNMLFVSNPWTQLLMLIGTGVLCLGVSLWFGAQHSGLHKRLPFVAARSLPISHDIEPHAPILHITSVVQHGRIVEIKGATEAGTVVMINGQPVATIFAGNTFRHFLGPLPTGTAIVSITCQDEQGGVNTQQLALTLN